MASRYIVWPQDKGGPEKPRCRTCSVVLTSSISRRKGYCARCDLGTLARRAVRFERAAERAEAVLA